MLVRCDSFSQLTLTGKNAHRFLSEDNTASQVALIKYFQESHMLEL